MDIKHGIALLEGLCKLIAEYSLSCCFNIFNSLCSFNGGYCPDKITKNNQYFDISVVE